jgi:hypothetical protein
MIGSLSSREQVIERSGARCEAMVALPRTWARCGKGPVEVHHALTRARGGALLDSVGETHHLIALCSTHHREVDDHGHTSGLMIQGSVYRDGLHLIYEGPDAYLRATYGKAALHPTAMGLSVVS